MSLLRQTLTGIAWTSVARAVGQVGSFVVTLLLARLLEPSDFGLIGMALVLSGFLALMGELGLGAALVQRADLDERHRSSAFWLSVGTGLLFALLLALSAPAIAAFYREPRLVPVIRMLSIDFVIAPLRSVQSALLSRNMAFRALAAVEITGVIASSVFAVVLALRGYGVWALVARTLASSSFQTLVLWSLSRWRPSFSVDRRALGELWKFSSHLLGFALLNYWARKADDLLIGRVLGPGPLGLYSRAYGTMMMPLTEISSVFGKVMFPVLSRIQDDRARIKALYLRAVCSISMVTFPLMLVLLVAAEPLVLVLYGEKWRGMIPTLEIYCVVGAFQSIGTTVGWIYQSQGRTDLMLRWGIVASSLIVAAIGFGVYLGSIESVAIAYALVNLVVLSYPLFSVPGRLIGLVPTEVARAVRGSLGCALFGAGLAWLAGRYAGPYLPHSGLALLELALGLGGALASARIFDVQAYREVRDLLSRRSRTGGAFGVGAPNANETGAGAPNANATGVGAPNANETEVENP
jgi:PST family polysaccharide transporter